MKVYLSFLRVADCVIVNGKQCSFSGMVFNVGGLELKVEVVRREMAALAVSY